MTFINCDRRAWPEGSSIGVWEAADGWKHRTFAWPSAAERLRGSILFQGGRGDLFEKYIEAFHHWHAAGWGVTSFDWRGQGGSGRLSANPGVGHASDFAPWIDDLAAFVEQWRAREPGPHVIVAHSMGGHLLMRALAEKRVAPDAAVLVAPMIGLRSESFGPRIAARIARLMVRLGEPARPAWKHNERPAAFASRQALLTHSDDRYADELWWKEQDPSLALGPPSWAWLATAYESAAKLESPGLLEAVTTPVLILVADADRLVDPAAARRAAARLPNARLVRFGPESRHEILREADAVRLKALAEIDAFLGEKAPAR